jgi:uncharacterized protein
MKGKVVHFEIPADNVKRASEFYKKTFEWHIQPIPDMNYTMLGTTPSNDEGMPTEPGAINGGMGAREGPLAHTVVTILVDDLDAAAKLVVKNGGTMVQKKTPIGPMGFVGYFKDTEGNVIGLFQQPGP